MHLKDGFNLGQWRVYPDANRLEGPAGEVTINARSMDVLLHLAEHSGEAVSRQDFSTTVWQDTVVTDDALNWCISELRRKLGDSAADPHFIETIPKRGYRLIESVAPIEADGASCAATSGTGAADPDVDRGRGRPYVSRRRGLSITLFAVLVVAMAAVLVIRDRVPETSSTPSIAVLPLADLGPGDIPLAEGMHQDLLTRLGQSRDLRVISATSVRRYRDTDKSIPEIAAELGVNWIVEGAVQQLGDGFQVNVQLIEAQADLHRWARLYRGDLTAPDLFAVQKEIINDIADSLRAELTSSDKNSAFPTENLTAYSMTVRARTLLQQRSESTMRQAASLFERAAGVDPSYADPLAGRANALFLLHYYGHETAEATLPRARELAERALALDDHHARARVVLAMTHLYLERDMPRTLDILRDAHRQQPEVARGWLSWLEATSGDLERGMQRMDEQLQSAPFAPSVHWSLSVLKLCAGDLDRALALTERAAELSPGYGAAYLTEGQILLLQGKRDTAIRRFELALEDFPDTEPEAAAAWLTAAEIAAGRIAPDDRRVEEILQGADPFPRAIVLVALDRPGDAIEALERVEWDDLQTLYTRYHPWFDPLRQRPDYSALIDKLDRWWGQAG
ncbi:MAG: winged helix-turn-helix domain-containing protein [Xanthomonadales bacterium]|nr:winged helix-turn-helix domain-containing protein [Xanthomonadales bacterium]